MSISEDTDDFFLILFNTLEVINLISKCNFDLGRLLLSMKLYEFKYGLCFTV